MGRHETNSFAIAGRKDAIAQFWQDGWSEDMALSLRGPRRGGRIIFIQSIACTNFSPALGAAIRPILAKGSHGSRNSAMAIRKPSTAKFDGRPGIQGSAVSNPGEELLALRNLPGVTPYPDWKARRNASSLL